MVGKVDGLDGSPGLLEQDLRDEEAQSHAIVLSHGARGGSLFARKDVLARSRRHVRLADPLIDFRGEARAVILDRYFEARGIPADLDAHTRAREVCGVLDNVAQAVQK